MVQDGEQRRRRRIVIAHRSSHHAHGSGAAGGVEQFHADVLIDRSAGRVPYRLGKLLARPLPIGYDSASFQREASALWAGLHTPRSPSHLFYLSADHDAGYLPPLVHALRWRTSAWFHTPPGPLREMLRARPSLRRLDGAWAIGSNQLEVLTATFGEDRVSQLPYAVDSTYFHPDDSIERERSVLFVGSHLRDFAQLDRVFTRLRALDPALPLRAVIHPVDLPLKPTADGVEILTGISDEELRLLYQRAGVIVAPTVEATANSSLLESIASGAAVVVSDVGAIRDYVSDASASLVPAGDDEAMIEAVRGLLDDPDRRKALGAGARQRALELSWAATGARFETDPLLAMLEGR